MRPILPALALIIAPLAAWAESGMCEYRHPAHPSWDFFASCSVTETSAVGATTREVIVSNGSRFTTRDEPGEASVNGRAALRLDRSDAACWRTEAEGELICIYPAETFAPSAPPPAAGPGSDFAPGALAVGNAFGGGTKGFCLLAEDGVLVEQGPCIRRENCLEIAAGEGVSCLVNYDWQSGRTTEMASAEGWTTLDGAAAIQGDPGCVLDPGAAIVFCHSKTAITAETHPVLARLGNQTPAGAVAPAPEGEGAVAAPTGAE
ncbi:MAG: hypothetical protein AUK37_09510 [Rhodobacterales bacterium CG2_30_65_12]|nr:MAG: hypothetical protein AUK37_09510 [Rhodobacterales bacterium CG2_30_65_12]